MNIDELIDKLTELADEWNKVEVFSGDDRADIASERTYQGCAEQLLHVIENTT